MLYSATNMTTKEKAIYLAGLFDGEGCILIANNGRTLRLTISINISYEHITPWIMRNFGGSVCDMPPKNQRARCWRWCAASRGAGQILATILPYLQVKAEEALIAIEFQNIVSTHPNNIGPIRDIRYRNLKESYMYKLRDVRKRNKVYD